MPRQAHIDLSRAATLKSIVAMLAAQAAFTANDTCVKLVTESLPLGETMVLRNALASLYILVYAAFAGGLSIPADTPRRAFSWRLVGEIGSTLLFLWALVRMPIADITAIGQITPLAITAAGAIFLGEPVGWRRWTAAFVGLAGVLLIVQPGTSAFTWAAIIALASNGFGVLRDLATRVIGPGLSTLTLTLTSIMTVMVAGLFFIPFETWHVPSGREAAILIVGAALLILGYALLIISMRTGDLATVSPFRYSAVLWALLSGYVLWGELPNVPSSIGIAIVVAAGLYALHRQRIRQSGKPDEPA